MKEQRGGIPKEQELEGNREEEEEEKMPQRWSL